MLHLAARDGHLESAKWLLDHGADANARNKCSVPCDARGQTPLHDGLAFKDSGMSKLLLKHGAEVDALADSRQTALHLAGRLGRLGGAFILCFHGADPTRTDAAGKTPYDLAREPAPGVDPKLPRSEGIEQLMHWLKPTGGCAIVAAKARASQSPVSEEEGREVFAANVPLRR